MDNETYNKFAALVCRLSPENLHCDGECSRAEVIRRHNQIMREWRMLETEMGRKVTQEEIENKMMQEYRTRR